MLTNVQIKLECENIWRMSIIASPIHFVGWLEPHLADGKRLTFCNSGSNFLQSVKGERNTFKKVKRKWK